MANVVAVPSFMIHDREHAYLVGACAGESFGELAALVKVAGPTIVDRCEITPSMNARQDLARYRIELMFNGRVEWTFRFESSFDIAVNEGRPLTRLSERGRMARS